jgi:cobalamin biosynthesis Mg chelatase CobN
MGSHITGGHRVQMFQHQHLEWRQQLIPQGGENKGKAYEVSSASGSANPETGLPVYAIVGIVAIVGLLGLGYFFGPGRN